MTYLFGTVWRRCSAIVAIAVMLSLVATTCHAQAGKSQQPPAPSGNEIDGPVLNAAIHAALACGVNNLLMNAETNWSNLFVEPNGRHYQYITRFSLKQEVCYEPIYKHEYEEYETYGVEGGVSSVDGKTLKKVTGQRIIASKIVGTNKVERSTWVHAADGTNIVVNTVNTYWQPGFMAMNGMALYTVLRAGVPETNAVVAKTVDTLKRYILSFGAPDTTLDLAWMTAAFSCLRNSDAVGIRSNLVNKLLLAQITDGTARGLWGPVAINPELLAAMLAYEQTLGKEVSRLKADAVKELKKPRKDKTGEKVAATERLVEELQAHYRLLAAAGLDFDKVTIGKNVTPDMSGGENEVVVMPGLPFYIYDQTLADLEMTSLALFALREAARNGFLPAETSPPRLSKGPAIIPAEKTSAIFARAASAITALQKKDGTWDEGNIYQPHTNFTVMGMGPVTKDKVRLNTSLEQQTKEKIMPVASTNSCLSTAQAYAALVDAGQSAGIGNLINRYGEKLQLGLKAQSSLARDFIENRTNNVMISHTGLPCDQLVHWTQVPYDLIYKLTGLQRAYGTGDIHDYDIWRRYAYRILNMQNDDGWWGDGAKIRLQSTSTYARMDAFLRKTHEDSQKKVAPAKAEPYNPVTYWVTKGYVFAGSDFTDNRTLCTVYAATFLLDGVREPFSGYIASGDQANVPKLLSDAGKLVQKRLGVTPDFVRVTAQTSASAIQSLPALHVRNELLGTEQWIKDAVKWHLASGRGILLVETARGGAADVPLKTSEITHDAKLKDIPTNAPFMAELKAAPVKLQGLYSADKLIAVVLQVRPGAIADSGEVTQAQAAYIAKAVMKSRMPAGYFDRDYPIQCAERANPLIARVSAMHDLIASTANSPAGPAPASKTEDGKEPAKGGTPAATNATKPATPAVPEEKANDSDALPMPAKVVKKARTDEIW